MTYDENEITRPDFAAFNSIGTVFNPWRSCSISKRFLYFLEKLEIKNITLFKNEIADI